MNENTTVLIERVGNGFLVRPVEIVNGMFYPARPAEGLVFQHMGRHGGDEHVRDEDTLCGWIARHFPTPDKA